MPIRYRIDKEERLVRAEVRGDFTTSDMIRALDNMVRDPDFEPGFNFLSDHAAVGEPVTPEQLDQLIAHLESLSEVLSGARWAIVATKPASYGMMRMLSVLAEAIPLRVAVFESLESAEEWARGS